MLINIHVFDHYHLPYFSIGMAIFRYLHVHTELQGYQEFTTLTPVNVDDARWYELETLVVSLHRHPVIVLRWWLSWCVQICANIMYFVCNGKYLSPLVCQQGSKYMVLAKTFLTTCCCTPLMAGGVVFCNLRLGTLLLDQRAIANLLVPTSFSLTPLGATSAWRCGFSRLDLCDMIRHWQPVFCCSLPFQPIKVWITKPRSSLESSAPWLVVCSGLRKEPVLKIIADASLPRSSWAVGAVQWGLLGGFQKSQDPQNHGWQNGNGRILGWVDWNSPTGRDQSCWHQETQASIRIV